jgi:hypothetical protein
MMDICQKALNLLNKPASDPAFKQFLKDVDSIPHLVDDCDNPKSRRPLRKVPEEVGPMTFYTFQSIGLSICSANEILVSVRFHITSEDIVNGNLQPYTYELPLGISVEDGRQEVHTKLGPPVQSRRIGASKTETYQLNSYLLAFDYALPLGNLTGVQVLLTPEDFVAAFVLKN